MTVPEISGFPEIKKKKFKFHFTNSCKNEEKIEGVKWQGKL